MQLLHREIFKELATIFGLTVSSLLGLILLGRMLQLRDMLMAQNLGVLDLFQLFFYLSPFFLLLITPIACMLSVFLTFLRMSTDNELTALRAGGVSLYQMLPAPVIFCIICTLFTYFVSFVGLSWGMDMFKSKLVEFAKTRSDLALQAGVFNQDFPNLTFYAEKVDDDADKLKFVFVQDRTLKGTSIIIVAPEGSVSADSRTAEVNIGFTDGRIFRKSGNELSVLQFGEYKVKLPLGELLGSFSFDRNKPSEMSFERLLTADGNPTVLKERGAEYLRKIRTEIHKRLSQPLGCLVLGLFVLPIAVRFSGLKKQYGLVVSLGLFMVYYTMFSLGLSLGETGALPPIVGLWGPNILFAGLGVAAIRIANSERSLPFMPLLRYLISKRASA